MVERAGHVNRAVTRPSPVRDLGHPAPYDAGKRPSRRAPRLLAGLLLSLLTTLVAVGGGILAWQQHYSERVIPGVWIAGVPLEGLTAPEAHTTLQRAWADVGPRHLTLRDGDRQWVLPLEELGITWDLPATVEAVLSVGHSGSFWQDWATRLRGLQQGLIIAPIWSFDEGRCNLTLRRLAREIDLPPRSATLDLVGAAPRSEPAAAGRELDVDATCQRLREALHSGLPQTLDLPIRTLSPTVADGEAARQRAEELLSRQVTVTFTEDGIQRRWAIGREIIAQALVARQEVGTDGLTRWTIDLKADPFAEWVAGIAREIDRPLLVGRVRVDPATLLASLELPGQSGRKVDTTEAIRRLLAAVETDPATVELPAEVVRPYLTREEVGRWGQLTVLSEGTSSFRGSSPGRAQNILVGTSRYQGIVLPPGATFSFNEHLGPITLAEGWAEGHVIIGDRTELGAGGGICQVATTAFRAAFFGGFPIVERQAHSYRVAWYEPPLGLDAAVFAPLVDFKFRNDLPFPVIIHGYADGAKGALSFRLYGPGQLGRTVEMEGPVLDRHRKAPPPVYEDDPTLAPGQVILEETARDGVRATVHRVIKQGHRIVARERFVSDYRPWPARYRRGPQR